MNINYASTITQFLIQCIYLTRLNVKLYYMYIQGMYSEVLYKKVKLHHSNSLHKMLNG